MDRVGIRELRQHASRVVERVEAGETIEVTNHGRLVARLVPIDRPRTRGYEELVAAGLIRRGRGNVLDVEPIVAPPGSPSSEEILDEMRAERLP